MASAATNWPVILLAIGATTAIVVTTAIVFDVVDFDDIGGNDSGDDSGDESDGACPADGCNDGAFATLEWEAKDWDVKLQELWDESQLNQQVQPQPFVDIRNLFIQEPRLSFLRAADNLPPNRPKINHAQGVLTKVEWQDLGGHSYTGLYSGNSEALLRMSESNFLVETDPASIGLTPSLAMKFPRSGMRSVNHLANVSFENMEGWNFFEHNFRSRVDFHENDCAAETIELVFLDDNPRPHSLGLSEFASYKQDGTEETNVEFPFELWFEPTTDVYNQIETIMTNDPSLVFYDQLTQITTGTTLYKVMAKSLPNDSTSSYSSCINSDS